MREKPIIIAVVFFAAAAAAVWLLLSRHNADIESPAPGQSGANGAAGNGNPPAALETVQKDVRATSSPESGANLPQGQEVSITADRRQYGAGQNIAINIKNNSDKSIFFTNYRFSDLRIWNIEKFADGKWGDPESFDLPIVEKGKKICAAIFYERPVGFVDELKAGGSISSAWDQLICTVEGARKILESGGYKYDFESIGPGRYRLSFRYGLGAVKTPDLENKLWEMPLTITGEKNVYSDEFEIK